MYTGVMENEPADRTVREIRQHFADVVNDAIQGRVTYVTSRGRRVAVIGPLALADPDRNPEQVMTPASGES